MDGGRPIGIKSDPQREEDVAEAESEKGGNRLNISMLCINSNIYSLSSRNVKR